MSAAEKKRGIQGQSRKKKLKINSNWRVAMETTMQRTEIKKK